MIIISNDIISIIWVCLTRTCTVGEVVERGEFERRLSVSGMFRRCASEYLSGGLFRIVSNNIQQNGTHRT